jgi:hypothetical protein
LFDAFKTNVCSGNTFGLTLGDDGHVAETMNDPIDASMTIDPLAAAAPNQSTDHSSFEYVVSNMFPEF